MIGLEVIFRSVINLTDQNGQETVSQANLVKNFRALNEHVPHAPSEKAYRTLYHFLFDYLRSSDTREEYQMPSYDYLVKWFSEEEGDEAVLAILDKIKIERPYIGQDYRRILKQYNEERDVEELEQILVDTNKIAKVGIKDGKGRNERVLKGIPDSIDYFARSTRKLRQQVTGVKLESQILTKEDILEEQEHYKKIEKDPTEAFGVYFGLEPIDAVCKGLKNTELMLVCAFTSQGKTTFSMYAAYRAINAGWNVGVISLEQSHEEIRRQLYVKHTCNVKWESDSRFAHLVGTISVEDVTTGLLTEEQRNFYFAAQEDLASTEEYGRLYLKQPDKALTTVADIEFWAMQWQQELRSSGRDLEVLIIDYITLLGLPKEDRSRDQNENLNTIMKQLKRLCLTFNNGKGIRVISPWQSNRKGWEEAKANEGVYQLTALSNAHEAERSSDIVIALFIDQSWREEGKVKLSCLKNRRHAFFKPFFAKINFKSLFYTEGVSVDLDEEAAIKNLNLVV